MTTTKKPHLVIVGGGFGGLYTAKALKDAPVNITLVDKQNYHLFQPLLYQVATGGLSPGDIAYPLRAALSKQDNCSVLKAEVVDIDPSLKRIYLDHGELSYDTLVIATGVSHHYFGHDDWAKSAPGLKTLEDSLEIRRRILSAFEAAEREPDPEKHQAWLTFVVVGGGPTGVEMAGALAELAHNTLRNEFRNIDPSEAKIMLLEGANRILPIYPPELSDRAEASLAHLGVTVLTETLVTDVRQKKVIIRHDDQTDAIPARTVLWAAGMKASSLGQVLAERTEAEMDQAGRVIVEPNLTIAGQPDIFVVGDLAHFARQDGLPLPGVAPVAMQQGQYVARLIKQRLNGKSMSAFRYVDKGNLAVIGRNEAVADMGWLKLGGFPAWLAWLFIHIWFLVGFDNKLLVLFQWAWNYFTWKRGARLIIGDEASVTKQEEIALSPGLTASG
jgi:NADH dehydrogenase